MMPTARISDANWERLKKHARPLEDTVDDVIGLALDALEKQKAAEQAKMNSDDPPSRKTAVERIVEDLMKKAKLPQRQFRIPLLQVLQSMGGKASPKDVRPLMEKKMASKLQAGDYETVTGGDPRWWNATCWARHDLVKEGLMKGDSDHGIWEISDKGRGELARAR